MDALKSKKLAAAIVGTLLQFFGRHFGLDEATIENLTVVIGTYIVGQGIADVGKEKAKTEAKLAGR